MELLPWGVVRKLYENKTTEIVVLVEVCNVMSCWRGRQQETDEANRGKKRVKRFVEIVVSKGNNFPKKKATRARIASKRCSAPRVFVKKN